MSHYRDIPPRWALHVVSRVMRDYDIQSPYLVWTIAKRKLSTGYCVVDGREIGVKAGSDHLDARYTLFHELAHLILVRTKYSYQGDHDDTFYDFLWPFFRRYSIPMRYALDCEGIHHRNVVSRTYKRSGGNLSVPVYSKRKGVKNVGC